MDPITPLSVYRDHYKPGDPEGRSWSKSNHNYVSLKVGWIYSREMRAKSINTTPGPSYSRITNETIVDHVDEKPVIATINDYQVFLNGILIASAPSGKNKAFKDRFCKAVVWSLLNDPSCLEDKLQEISGIISDVPAPVPVEIPVPVKVDPFQGLTPVIVTCHYSVYEVPA